jgi:hypothetical protein
MAVAAGGCVVGEETTDRDTTSDSRPALGEAFSDQAQAPQIVDVDDQAVNVSGFDAARLLDDTLNDAPSARVATPSAPAERW